MAQDNPVPFSAFTIGARNYLAFSLELGESVLRHHPGASFTIWLLDPGELPPVPDGIEIRPISDALSAEELESLGFYYEILELATAVKPRCFRRLFEDGATRVVYIDPDIKLFRPLTEVMERLDEGAAGVLTPHIMAPLGFDAAKPDDLELLQAGIYNLGFLALERGDAADALLDWWWGWLRTQCFSDKATGTFTDQKWMNFAPLFWPKMAILRDSTYNVAYWNLPQRRLEYANENWTVDGRPLTFYHFSGFDPERPDFLSKHQTRIDVRKKSALDAILRHYADAILARGHRELSRIPLPPVRFSNGVPVDGIARRVFREALAQGMNFPRPLRVGVGSFFSWLGRPVFRDLQDGHPRSLTRYLLALYELRPDVRQTYPDLYGADREGFLHWVGEKAVSEMGAAPEMIERQQPPAPRTVDPATVPDTPPAVNLSGYLRAALGIGEAARGYAHAMKQAGIDVRFVDTTHLCSSPQNNDATLELNPHDPASVPAKINVIHVNADQLMNFRDEVGPEFFRDRYNIAIWAWETSEFPEEWHDRFALLDEVWVGSSFIAEAIAPVSPVPVVRIPHVVELPEVSPDRARFDLPEDEYLFLFYFDFHSTPARKNPGATIEAFRAAFGPDDRVRLVLKSMNGRSRPEALSELKKAAEGLRVTFIDEALDSDDRYRLLRSCDAFVSLHRAEGFGLGMAEAMAYGMPVVATGWSGNMDFMNDRNSFPVRYELLPLDREDPPYEKGTIWALPDIGHAAEQMRLVAEDRVRASEVGARARSEIEKYNSATAIGAQILARLEVIDALLLARARQGGGPRLPSASGYVGATNRPLAVGTRSLAFRALRGVWRTILRLTPVRFHPRLQRLSIRIRRLIPV